LRRLLTSLPYWLQASPDSAAVGASTHRSLSRAGLPPGPADTGTGTTEVTLCIIGTDSPTPSTLCSLGITHVDAASPSPAPDSHAGGPQAPTDSTTIVTSDWAGRATTGGTRSLTSVLRAVAVACQLGCPERARNEARAIHRHETCIQCASTSDSIP
jgi:hypothetical protein